MSLSGSSERGMGEMFLYQNLSPMGDEQWLLKGGGVVIFLLKIRPPHRQLVYSYLCTHVVILHFFCHVLAYAI